MSAVTTRWRWVCTLAVLLASCGGGGGGGGSSGGGSDNNWLSFSPAAVDLTVYEDEPAQTFRVTATSSKTISGVFNVAIIDNSGILDAAATSVQANSEYSYTASLKLLNSLPAGTRTGNLEIRLCRDDPRTCANPIEGSPWQLPYTLTVKSNKNLTPLRPLAGAQDWTMFQGSARHTGYVPAQLEPTTFSRRFRYTVPGADGASDIVVAGGLAVAAAGNFSDNWTLHGVDEATGTAAWTVPMGVLNTVSAPTLIGGKVYAISNGSTGTFCRTFAATDGTQFGTLGVPSLVMVTFFAPTVVDGAVYSQMHDRDNGMSRINASGDNLDWFAPLLPPFFDTWTPAVEGSFAYAAIGSLLYVLNVADGSTAFTITDENYQTLGIPMPNAAVLADGGVVYASRSDLGYAKGHVTRFDTATQTQTWSAGTEVKSQPVLAGNTIYVLDGQELHARSAQTGALLWSWQASSDFANGNNNDHYPAPLVVVGHHAFFSTAEGTQALDLNTRKIVWSDPASGRLAVSANGILYIRSATALVAVNLH